MPDPPKARDVVARLMDGYLQTQLLYVAARLGLADLLASGPRSAEDLAAAAGADASVLHRILRGLAINGIVEEGDGVFGLTDAGRYLQSGTADSLRGAMLSRGDLYYRAASGLLEAARDGGAAFRHVFGTEFSITSPHRRTGSSPFKSRWWLALNSRPEKSWLSTTSAGIAISSMSEEDSVSRSLPF